MNSASAEWAAKVAEWNRIEVAKAMRQVPQSAAAKTEGGEK